MRGACLLAALCCGCYAPRELLLDLQEVLPAGAGSVVLALGSELPPERALVAIYAPGDALALPATVPEGAQLGLAIFGPSPEALGLTRGVLSPSPSNRRFPLDGDFFQSAIDAPRTAWSRLPGAPRAIADFPLPELDLLACLRAGGCLDPQDDGAPFCVLPCPWEGGVQSPLAPTPPVAPVLEPLPSCPPAWAERALERCGSVCAPPPPELDPPPCPDGQYRRPSTGAAAPCAPVSACAEWPASLDDARTAFVRQGAAGGDGSRAAPYGDLDAALLSVRPVIALASGRYHAGAPIQRAVEIHGVCAADTVLEPGPLPETLRAGGVQVRLSGLRVLTGGGGLVLDAAGELWLEQVQVEGDGTPGIGVLATGPSHLELRDVYLLDHGTEAVRVEGAATATLTRVVVEGGGGIYLRGPRAELREVALRGTSFGLALETHAALETVEISDTQAGGLRGGPASVLAMRDLRLGRAGAPALSFDQSVARVERLQVYQPAGGGVALSAGSSVSLSWADIDCAESASPSAGIAVVGATLAADRVAVRGCSGFGVGAASSALSLSRSVVLDTKAGANNHEEIFLLGARLRGAQLCVANEPSHGIAGIAGSTLELQDVQVIGKGAGTVQQGVVVADDGAASLLRTRIDRQSFLGLNVYGRAQVRAEDLEVRTFSGLAVLLTDAELRWTRGLIAAADGRALEIAGDGSHVGVLDLQDLRVFAERGVASGDDPLLRLNHAQLSLERVEVSAPGRTALRIGGDSQAMLTDLRISEAGRHGLVFSGTRSAQVSRALIERAAEHGLLTEDYSVGEHQLIDLAIHDCGADGVHWPLYPLTLERFESLRSGGCGVALGVSPAQQLRRGEVAGSGRASLCVPEGSDLSRVARGVRYQAPLLEP